MQITLNIYERGFEGTKQGRPFEPQVWHRVEFLQKNFVRFFSQKYITDELYVEVSAVSEVPEAFSFDFNGYRIDICTKVVSA